ncbi:MULTISPECIES: hypothetical protein [unclassified Acinetobacter]|uniref:hypothetical protein n=1 Tax=unclassified Acinetobacter TaxID=196816 RepID=UPI002577B584|nr:MULTISPECIES: hypothetical protein [unclassified Acinetobacter]MDM1765842.1 DUF4303 domain-containing protein [Acinetobacter sp. 226-1]MDM1769580.1 DUF4303 domain-containing protein [Acinetobacter sp. 226-4]
MTEKTNLYLTIYQDIQDACAELKQETLGQHLQIIGLGLVEDLCGYFVVGMTLEEFSQFDQELVWFISEWSIEASHNNHVHQQIQRLYEQLGEEYTEEQYIELRQHYQNTIIQVLQDLRKEGKLQNQQGDEMIFILQYADAFDEDFEEISFAQINPSEYISLFSQRFKQKKGDNLHDFLLEKYKNL